MTDLTCGTCRHWHAGPINPADLSERNGECRHSPPTMVVVPTNRGAAIQPMFPQLNSKNVACGQHAHKPIAIEGA